MKHEEKGTTQYSATCTLWANGNNSNSQLNFFSTPSVGLFTVDGNKIAQSTGVDLLLQSDFDLKINDSKYRVEVPEDGKYHQEFGSLSYCLSVQQGFDIV